MATTRDTVIGRFSRHHDEVVRRHFARARLTSARAAVLSRLPHTVAAAPALHPPVLNEVRRMLASMHEFPFDSYWQSHQERYGCETGHTHRVAGDPIYDTLAQVAGVVASRAEIEEALAAVAEHRRPQLPPRMARLPGAVVTVAQALAAGRRRVRDEEGLVVTIEGPWLPPGNYLQTEVLHG